MQQRGFTLIELIIVIVILGILAVTAAPRFIDLSSDARASTMQGILGAVKSASQISHAALLLHDTDEAVDAEGVDIQSTTVAAVNRYPHAEDICDLIGLTTADGAVAALGTEDDTDTLDCDINDDDDELTISDTAAATPAECVVVYTEAETDAAPVITIDTDGC